MYYSVRPEKVRPPFQDRFTSTGCVSRRSSFDAILKIVNPHLRKLAPVHSRNVLLGMDISVVASRVSLNFFESKADALVHAIVVQHAGQEWSSLTALRDLVNLRSAVRRFWVREYDAGRASGASLCFVNVSRSQSWRLVWTSGALEQDVLKEEY